MDDTLSPSGSRDLATLTAGLDRPALQLVPDRGSGPTRFGGRPFAGADFPWPRKGRRPLSFVGQVDCAAVADWPARGRLLFFFDAEEQPWGFSPKDRGGWAVVHVSEAGEPTPWPQGLSIRFPESGMEPRPVRTWPTLEHPDIGVLRLDDDELETYCAFRERDFGRLPQHQVGGYPNPVQNDQMQLMCQLASNGIDCGEDPTGDQRFESLTPGARDWRLLLQVDSDDRLNFMWGDCGRLYFWIRQRDLAAGKFDEVWVVLQCC